MNRGMEVEMQAMLSSLRIHKEGGNLRMLDTSQEEQRWGIF